MNAETPNSRTTTSPLVAPGRSGLTELDAKAIGETTSAFAEQKRAEIMKDIRRLLAERDERIAALLTRVDEQNRQLARVEGRLSEIEYASKRAPK